MTPRDLEARIVALHAAGWLVSVEAGDKDWTCLLAAPLDDARRDGPVAAWVWSERGPSPTAALDAALKAAGVAEGKPMASGEYSSRAEGDDGEG